jgi:DNA-binding IclR family transcriptional regulator
MPFKSATERREEVIRILSGPEASLSNRKIARRLGIPDTTVAGIRRRMAAELEKLKAA